MDSFDICRVCMEEVKSYLSLFEECVNTPTALTPAALINECSGIDIRNGDGLPDLVCESCLEAMVEAYTIRQICIASDRKLRKILFHSQAAKSHRTRTQLAHSADSASSWSADGRSFEDELPVSSEQLEFTDSSDAPSPRSQGNNSCQLDVLLKQEPPEQPEPEEEHPMDLNEEYLIECTKDEPHGEDEDNDLKKTHIYDNINRTKVEVVDHNSCNTDSIEAEPKRPQQSEKKFICDVCNKSFSSKGNLKAHLPLHSDQKPYSCGQCGAKFSRKHNYNMHMIRHDGKRTHQCPECDKSFVCAVNLKAHFRKHSGTRPFKCDYCDKAFSHRSDKTRHEVSHTGVYPHCCEFCQRKFTRKSLLIRHLSTCTVEDEDSVAYEPIGNVEHTNTTL